MAEDIDKAFRTVRRPRWFGGLRTLDDVPLSISAGPISVGPFGAWWRQLTSGPRMHHAAWLWLEPGLAQRGIEDFARIKAASGLDHLHDESVVPAVRDQARSLVKDHADLHYHVEERVALLEYLIAKPTEDALLREQRIRTRRALSDALICSDPMQSIMLCTQTMRFALEAAAQTVCLIMGRPQRAYGFTANLMIPTVLMDAGGPYFYQSKNGPPITSRAAELWKVLKLESGEPCLAVVVDTDGAGHTGFWVPLRKGEGDSVMPGAPAAYANMIGSAVFKERLPRLTGFPSALGDIWSAYIKTNLKERLFISLPFVVRSETQKPHVIAVLNVNADPQDGESWKRACHAPWLLLSQLWVADFIEAAYTAHMHRASLAPSVLGGRDLFPSLKTGFPIWDQLGTDEGNLLPGKERTS